MRIRSTSVAQGLKWFNCGWRFAKTQLLLLVMSAVVFVAIGWLLTFIPLVGLLLLSFLVPIVVSSSLLMIQNNISEKKPRKQNIWLRLKNDSKKVGPCLFGALGDMEKLIPVIALATAALVFSLLISIVETILAGPTRLDSVSLFSLDWASILRFLGARTFTLTLYGLVIATLFYTIPLHVLGKYPVDTSVMHSVRACIKNFPAFAAFIGIIAAPFIVAAIISSFSTVAGTVLMVTVSVLAYPIIICSSFCSYKLVFE